VGSGAAVCSKLVWGKSTAGVEECSNAVYASAPNAAFKAVVYAGSKTMLYANVLVVGETARERTSPKST